MPGVQDDSESVTADCVKSPEEESKSCPVELDRRDSVNMDKKVDTEEEAEHLHNTKEVCVLPGEVEEDLPAYIPVFCHRTQLELSSTDMDHTTRMPLSNTASQSENEEVVPFSLDDSFDYDNVALSPKCPVKFTNCGSS